MTQSIAQDAEYLTTIPGSRRERERLVRRYGDFQTAVAMRLRMKASGVNHVFHGRNTSARITEALLAEINRRIEAENTAGGNGNGGQ